jgi:glutamate-ammonia-ligase adenylyltransferase
LIDRSLLEPGVEQVPPLSAYSPAELAAAAAWPAARRALDFLSRSPASASDRLRSLRHRAWLEATVATFHSRASARAVCLNWSNAVDGLVAEAWRLACGEPERAGQAPASAAGPMAIFALGKLGARELNLSSDIDLIYVREDGSEPPARALREFQRLLAEATDFGFCCRVDASIRPGGALAPLCPTASEFENHYGYMGEMWERLALIRLRPLLGPAALRESVTGFARKFSFRRHLDYTVLEDLRALRARVRAESPSRGQNDFNLKLGIGGIREIELFTHSLQAMHGGRKPSLQVGSTSLALSELKAHGILPAADAGFLDDAYWGLRELENRIQGYEDQQTYWIDLEKGSPAVPAFAAGALLARTSGVAQIADSLLGDEATSAPVAALAADAPARLRALGYGELSIGEAWPRLLQATALSRRSEKDEAERMRFLAAFAERLAQIGLDKDLGLGLLVDFARAIRAKASFFSLLNREPRILDDLARLFSASPYLGGVLCSRPELIDGFLWRATEAIFPGEMEELLDELAERRLLTEIVAANRFLANRALAPLQQNLTDAADAIAPLLLARVRDECVGPGNAERVRQDPVDPANEGPAAAGLGLVALGKWGGRELGLKSDLDFIFVSDGEPGAESQKVARRFLSRLSQPRRGGAIYSVDTRLRPSGSSGPLMVSWESLRKYVATQAAAWERQAYLRARAPLAPPEPSRDLARIAAERGLSDEDRAELRAIRAQLFAEAPGEIDLKLAPGGLACIEFAAQIALLDERTAPLETSTSGMIQCLVRGQRAWAEAGAELIRLHESLRAVEQMHQLTANRPGSRLRPKSEGFLRLARALDREPLELEREIRELMGRATELVGSVDPLK